MAVNPLLYSLVTASSAFNKRRGERQQAESKRNMELADKSEARRYDYLRTQEQRQYSERKEAGERTYRERQDRAKELRSVADRVNTESLQTIDDMQKNAIKYGIQDEGIFGYLGAAREGISKARGKGEAFDLTKFGGEGTLSDISRMFADKERQQTEAKANRESATDARANRYATLAEQREQRLNNPSSQGYKQYPVVNYGGRKIDVKAFKDSPEYRSAESDWKRHNDIYQEISGMNDKEKNLYIRGYRWRIDTRPDSETKGQMVPVQDPGLSIASDYGTFYTDYKNAQVKFQNMNDAISEAVLKANSSPEDEADDEAFNAGLELILGDDNE